MDTDKLPACPVDPFLSTLSDWLRPDFWALRIELAMEHLSDPSDPTSFRAAIVAAQTAAHNVRRTMASPKQMPVVDMLTMETVQEYASRVFRYRLGDDDRTEHFPGHERAVESLQRAATEQDDRNGPNPPHNGPSGPGGGSPVPRRPPVPRAPRPGGAAVAVPVA